MAISKLRLRTFPRQLGSRHHPGLALGRWSLLLVMLLGHSLISPPSLFGDSPQVTQEIRYYMPEAGEVVLVWGINGWQVAPKVMQPAGTEIKERLMRTAMNRDGETFVLEIQVPVETKLDYGFLITKKRSGADIKPVWDGDQDSLVVTEDRVIEIPTKVTLSQVETSATTTDASLVTQEIRYYIPEAGEVVLVWGINGWHVTPEMMQPAGTVVKGVLMYTPMEPNGDTFMTKIQVPAGTELDYGFLITKKRSGADIEDIWEGDQDSLIVTEDGTVKIKTATTLAGVKELPKSFDIGLSLLAGVCLLFGFALILKRTRSRLHQPGPVKPALKIFCTGLSLCLLLLLIRATILNFGWISLQFSLMLVPYTLLAGYYDLCYVAVITVLFFYFLLLTRKNLKLQRLLYFIYLGIALFSLVMALLNIQIIRKLGHSFNYQWFYYSDFLTSTDAQNAVLANVSWHLLLNMVALSVVLVIAAQLFYDGLNLFGQYHSSPYLRVIALVPLFLYFPIAAKWNIGQSEWDYPRLVNPIASFLQSVIEAQTHPGLFSLDLPPSDFEEFKPDRDSALENTLIQYRLETEIRNVVVFILESTPAEYVGIYGGDYPVTPELDSYLKHALIFNNIYSHAPTSNKSMVSILGSIYPWITYHALTKHHPAVNLPTLSSELKKNGYRTAFLSTSDWQFQNGNEFLAHRQFDRLEDYYNLSCDRQSFRAETTGSSHYDGLDDECLTDTFKAWVDEDPKQPFFAMLWPVGTHYPYFVMDEEIDYGVKNKAFNRYLNAIHHIDNVLGQLLRTLESEDQFESTLVVVVGDHGEAFGRHDQSGHASKIYEENIHVPLIFINPSLFDGQENPTVGGHIDIAPTVMHILNLPAPATWQGQSLLRRDRTGRIYFFAPWSDLLFGYREDNLKFIFNATTNRNEIYDLSTDPYETTNLITQMPEMVSLGHQHLAAWVQYQDEYIKKLLGKSD